MKKETKEKVFDTIGAIGFMSFIVGASAFDGSPKAAVVLIATGLLALYISAKATGHWNNY